MFTFLSTILLLSVFSASVRAAESTVSREPKQHYQEMAAQDDWIDLHRQNYMTPEDIAIRECRRPQNEPKPPRGRMTAYAFFVQTSREEHKQKHPDENIMFAEFSKKCAETWIAMSEQEKQRFYDMAEQDKRRYEMELQNYVPPKTKDTNAPKRPLSAFFWFTNDERSKVRDMYPEYSEGDIARELGKRWKDADPETKAKYEHIEEMDKARYEKELELYKKCIEGDADSDGTSD